MNTALLKMIPVLPSSDLSRDLVWYELNTGFRKIYADDRYAVLKRGDLSIHLQWHANTKDDPLLGGSVIKIMVDNIEPIFNEFVKLGVVKANGLQLKTAWRTNEFGFYDLNNNAIFFFEAL